MKRGRLSTQRKLAQENDKYIRCNEAMARHFASYVDSVSMREAMRLQDCYIAAFHDGYRAAKEGKP